MKRGLLISSAAALVAALLGSACVAPALMPYVAPIAANNIDVGKVAKSMQSAKDLVSDIPEAQEIELGQGIAANLLSLAPLYKNPKAQAYVNHVGRWLALQTERPDLPWTFAVLDDNEYNAFAAPGGYIVITKGLLLKMHSESELAGVLAHEMSHVLKKHHLIALRKAAGTSLATDLLSMGVQKKGLSPEVLKWASAGTELYGHGLDRDDELEADRMGVVIAARAGYEPYGLPSVLQTLEALNPQDSGLSLLFKTHPPLADRIAALDKAMVNKFDAFEQQQDGIARFKANISAPVAKK
jgi:predicted Zn-dependent protease